MKEINNPQEMAQMDQETIAAGTQALSSWKGGGLCGNRRSGTDDFGQSGSSLWLREQWR